jgi:hypothetical protein
MKSVPMRGSAGSTVRITIWSVDEIPIAPGKRIGSGLSGIAYHRIDPTLPRTVLTSLHYKS